MSELLGFVAFVVLTIVFPALGLLRGLRVPVDLALVVPVGSALCAGSAFLALSLGHWWLFPAVLALVAAGTLRPGPWRRSAGPGARAVVPPCAALVAVLALTQYGSNRPTGDGGFALDPLVPYDTTFHVGVVRELALGYPPQVPGVSGFPLGYHLGTDLVRAAALRWAAIDPFDSISRFDVTLWGLALVLTLVGLAQAMRLPPAAIALAGWIPLLTDASFVFAANPQAHWWADLLRGNLLVSLVLANPIIPALGLALACLVALARHANGEGRGHLALAALLAGAVPFFKVFLGAHLLVGLGAAFLAVRPHRSALATAALPAALATAALAFGTGGESVAVAFAPLDLVRVTRESLGLAPSAGLAFVGLAIVWCVASLGLRVVGLWPAVRAVRSPHLAVVAAGAIALSAWPLGLAFRVGAPALLVTDKPTNDAAYLIEQGGPFLWLFALAALSPWLASRWRAVVAALALLLCLPATVQFVAKKAATPPDSLPASMVRAARAVAEVSQPGDVVLQRPAARYPPVPVILAGRRVAFERFTPYLTQFASKAALERRHEIVYRFFRTHDADEAAGIARQLDARFLCLYGTDRVRFEGVALQLDPVYEEPDARCYRLVY